MPKLSDHGTHELCLYVDDIDAATKHLRAHGVEVLGEKLALDGPEQGEDACYIYFRSPWGAMMELISYPNGRAYEAEFERPLWNPSKPELDTTRQQ
jgi:glyoxylase I family protein